MTAPPPPPPQAEAAASDTPSKKPWSKPTVLRITDGVLETKSGQDPDPTVENATYHPTS